MCDQEDCTIKISDFSKLMSIVNTGTLTEHVRNQKDLRLIHILLKDYSTGIEHGSKKRMNLTLNPIVDQITEQNADEVCNVLRCGLQIQSDNTECNNLYDNLKNQPINLPHLKVLNVLLEQYPQLLNLDLLANYLKLLYIDAQKQVEYKFFIENLMPRFLLHCNVQTALDIIWASSYQHKDLMLISSIPTQFLASESFLCILQTDIFWSLLLEELTASEGFKYKVAMYLFNVSLELLKTQTNFANRYVTFEIDNRDMLLKSLDYFCILIDVTREKQLHLIEPSLHMLNKINNLSPVWINLVYKKILCHPHNAVGYYGLIYLIKLSIVCDFQSIFATLNKSDDSNLSKRVFNMFRTYCLDLDDEHYINMMEESLLVTWNPVAVYKFYTHSLIRPLDVIILHKIIKNCKKIPHRYIRQGLMYILFMKMKTDIGIEKVSIAKYLEIILELMLDDCYYKYATKLINLTNLVITDEFLIEITRVLSVNYTTNQKVKIDFLIELTERKDLPGTFTKSLYQDFKARRYSNVVLDRLSYLYLIKASDLQDYLLQRLDDNDEAHCIRHMDKPNYDLICKSIGILCSNKSTTNQQVLAFEILFYMTKSNYNNVYSYWFNKILNENHLLVPSLALSFVNLLVKIPTNYGIKNLDKIVNVYIEFFNSQTDNVLVKIYRNFDFILENVTSKDLHFLEISCNRLLNLKAREDVDNATRYLIRSIALNYKAIDKKVLTFLLEKLHGIAVSNEATSDVVIYYSTMYFKYLNFDLKLFPIYEFLLYPNEILYKNERAEYEICTAIYLNIHSASPYFRAAEIRKWALEDVLFDAKPDKITQTVHYLLEVYKQHFNKRYFPDSTLHLQKFRIMQIFAFLMPTLESSTKEMLLNFLIDSFTLESHQNSVRILMQYLLVQLLKDRDDALDIICKTLDSATNTHASTITGFVPVFYGLDLIKDNSDFSHKIIENVLVWTMGPHFKLRFYAQKLIREICYKHRNNFKFKRYEPLYKAVDYSLRATQVGENMNLDFLIIEFINKERPWKDHKKLMYIVTTYIPEVTSVCVHEWEYFKIKHFWSKYSAENLSLVTAMADLTMETTGDNVQKKITPWQDALETERSKTKGNLILVASLIESPANLGGLSRTCEIFGGQMLVVNNKKVIEHKEFSSLSMSSERWLDINEVKANELPEFLKKYKELNYRIVGVEQTSDSGSLDKYKFNPKTLLLLGNERSGIPAPLIGLMDDCVEIPQFGMIRSLNVHVAGALVVWEYTKQNMVRSLP